MTDAAQLLAQAIQFHQQGDLQQAKAWYTEVLKADPGHPDALHLVGQLLFAEGRREYAAKLIGHAIANRPHVPAYHQSLARVLLALNRFAEAEVHCDKFLQASPDDLATLRMLADAQRAQGKTAAAVETLRRVTRGEPNSREAHQLLGVAAFRCGDLQQAAASLERALELAPDDAESAANLGGVYREQRQFDRAEAACRTALRLDPDNAAALNNLGGVYQYRGEIADAIACYERALQAAPDFHDALHNLVYAAAFKPGITAKALHEVRSRWDEQCARPLLVARRYPNSTDPNRRLRIGFVSPSYARHPGGFLFLQLLRHVDRRGIQVVCYSDRTAGDELTEQIRQLADEWHEVAELSDDQLADQVLADRIDVLIAQASHTSGNRLLMFARKPAPLQAMWTGGGPSGMRAFDYLLADRWLIAPDTEPFYRESVVRLPDDYICFDPPAEAPEVGPLPAARNGFVTFGSMNQLSKLNDQVVATWATILRRVPGSKLIVKYKGLEGSSRDRFVNLFRGGGIEESRLVFSGGAPRSEFLGWYNRIDIALDPFPFSGGITTCEALWMGVPIVTWPQQTLESRTSLSHLTNAGLTTGIATDASEYVEAAVRMAEDPAGLASLRSSLRAQVAGSRLCDGPRFARGFEQTCRALWRTWCESADSAW